MDFPHVMQVAQEKHTSVIDNSWVELALQAENAANAMLPYLAYGYHTELPYMGPGYLNQYALSLPLTLPATMTPAAEVMMSGSAFQMIAQQLGGRKEDRNCDIFYAVKTEAIHTRGGWRGGGRGARF